MIYILIFNGPNNLDEAEYYFEIGGRSNINSILESFDEGITNWAIPKNRVPGDIAIFYCGKETWKKISSVASHIPKEYSQEFRDFANEQKQLYKNYSGCILGYGIVESKPVQSMGGNTWWMADVGQLCRFETPIYIDEFKSFIDINKLGTTTYLKKEQWERLKWIVNEKNPGIFQNVIAPYIETMNLEFMVAVQKEKEKPLEKLEKETKKATSTSAVASVQTKVYYRSPVIAAYVKKRANGHCNYAV